MKDLSLSKHSSFLTEAECSAMENAILSFRDQFPIPHVVRECPERNLNYSVIDGHLIAKYFPAITSVSRKVMKIVDKFSEFPVAPLANSRVAINVNITRPGGEYRWHYDRNLVTAVLYLNEIDGGEIELLDDYRILLDHPRLASMQKLLDRVLLSRVSRWIFSRKRHLIKPRAGELVIMKANKCLHSVRQVLGTQDRVCIVFAYDMPGRPHGVDSELDRYLYSNQSIQVEDPNYARKIA